MNNYDLAEVFAIGMMRPIKPDTNYEGINPETNKPFISPETKADLIRLTTTHGVTPNRIAEDRLSSPGPYLSAEGSGQKTTFCGVRGLPERRPGEPQLK
jgi:hypothetical protein